MRTLLVIIMMGLLAGSPACTKRTCSDHGIVSTANLNASGTLQKQGTTTYQYGSHILIVNATTTYVLKSSSINLDPFVGKKVTITSTNTHYNVDGGPDLYDVTYIVAQ